MPLHSDLKAFIALLNSHNVERLIAVLRDFGLGQTGLTAEDFGQPNTIIQLGHSPNRIDRLTGLTGITFEEAWEKRIADSRDGIPTFYLIRQDLITNKKTLGRAKDLAALERIEASEDL